jgi:hypothetical protein
MTGTLSRQMKARAFAVESGVLLPCSVHVDEVLGCDGILGRRIATSPPALEVLRPRAITD